MRIRCLVFWFCGYLCLSAAAQAQPVKVSGLRFWTDPESTRLVFDVSEKVEYQVQVLEKPNRLRIDLKNTALAKQLLQPPGVHPLLGRMQSAKLDGGGLRIEVNLKSPVQSKAFALAPNKIYGDRLVIDLSDGKAEEQVFAKAAATVVTPSKQNAVSGQKPPKMAEAQPETTASKSAQSPPKASKPPVATVAAKSVVTRGAAIIVAIDAGHGGEDPGAHGQSGIEEKAVVYAISKKLEKLLRAYPGIKPVMVRKGDYYVPLRKRMDIARDAKADLFVSIHADAFHDDSVKGSSVFVLSSKGASNEAAHWLADSENAADLVGGVSLDGKDDVLASVLLDLSQTATQEASQSVAKRVLRNLSKIGAMHHNVIQKAGFVVLKSPDIPSILVETAFISNPQDEQKLRSERYQSKVAQAIFNGILDYFNKPPPVAARVAANGEASPAL